jgi:hypothetical protein
MVVNVESTPSGAARNGRNVALRLIIGFNKHECALTTGSGIRPSETRWGSFTGQSPVEVVISVLRQIATKP